MPGLVGFTHSYSCRRAAQITERMRRLISHLDFHVSDADFCDTSIACSRVHTGIVKTDSHSSVWIDGEYSAANFHAQYESDPNFGFLRGIDAIYSAVVYDEPRQLLHLITDRYGLRHLYWAQKGDQIAWASEVKAFTALPWFTPKIQPEALEDFQEFGYLTGNRTWLQGVELLPPATVLTFDLKTRKIESRRYWSWSDIKPLTGKLNEDEIAEELGRLFKRAVAEMAKANVPVGVSLSGGLDSRAVLAAVPFACETVTFGVEGCDDIRIARVAAEAKKVPNHVVHLNAANWLENRAAGVWWTDGQTNLMHMHAIASFAAQRSRYQINLNGFLGDAVLGGSYQKDPRWTVTEKVDNRGRRLINEGTRLANNVLHNRLPFFQNDLMEFTVSLPDWMKRKSRIYNRMLVRCFPELFRSIPWQATGAPISWPRNAVRARILFDRAKRLITGVNTRDYVHYAEWLRTAPALQTIENLLFAPNVALPDFIDKSLMERTWREHMAGADRAETICGYATIELWLSRIFHTKQQAQLAAV